jgi:hypothetical protein
LGIFGFLFQILTKKRQKVLGCSSATTAVSVSFTAMPRPKKLSSNAKSQWQAGQSTFGPVKFDTEDASESEYNDSDDEEASSDEESTLQSISAMQSLYSVFLPAHLRSKIVEDSGSTVSMVAS